jgi:hypothetical protein
MITSYAFVFCPQIVLSGGATGMMPGNPILGGMMGMGMPGMAMGNPMMRGMMGNMMMGKGNNNIR